MGVDVGPAGHRFAHHVPRHQRGGRLEVPRPRQRLRQLAGWADYALLNRPQQRVGVVHAASNGTAVALFALSYRAYRRERQAAARRYCLLGLIAMGVGGALGGHLSYAQGAGVFRWQPVRALTDRSPREFLSAA